MEWHAVALDGPVGTEPVAAEVERPDGSGTRRILLVRSADGELHATQVACPHLGQPLTDATVDGDVLECSHHAYRYRLDDGRCVGPGDQDVDGLRVLPVREEGDTVLVALEDSAS